MKTLLGTLALALLAGCGKSGGSSDAAAQCGSKPLASAWTLNGTSQVSLVGLTLGQPTSLFIQVSGGAMCQMDFQANGSECSGTMIIANATYTGGGSGDPGCSSLNGVSTYTKSDGGLSICDVDHVCELWQ